MKKIERKEHGKILLGYVLLLALVVASFYGVWRQLEVLERPAAEETLIARRRSATFDFVLALHEAETAVVGIGAGQPDGVRRYTALVDTALVRLDTLRQLMTDAPQQARLDTLRALVAEKSRSVLTLIQMIGRSDMASFYDAQIEQIRSLRDSMANQRVERRVSVKTDSVVRPPKKKSFFRRLAEAFVPSKRDSVTVKQVVRDVSVDTLVSHVNPADTVAGLIGNVQDKARRFRVETSADLKRAIRRIGRESMAIGQRANLLLADFDAEEQRLADARTADARKVRRQAAFTLAGTTGCALLLAVFFLLLIGRDLRQARRYREELEAAHARAEHLLAVREKLMLAVTHDLKAPAGAVLGYADLLGRRTTDKRSASYVDHIRQAANHLLALVRSLLDFHKLDAHCVEPEHIPFDVAALFREISLAFQPSAQAKGLTLNYTADIATTHATGDPLRLRQMTENLLSNAIKFTSKGSVTLRVTARDERLTVSVSDTGRGIPADEQNRLFGEFSRMSNAQGEEGFGLGLAITRKNAQLLGGDIQVESREGEGSTFTFDIALDEAPEEKAVRARRKSLRVALLDDDVLQLQLCSTMLRNEGHDVHCFDTPTRLIPALRESRFDVLLTDIQMPGLNGFDLVRQLRDDPDTRLHALHIVAVTARDDINQSAFRQGGFDACLRKPFSPSALRACLDHANTPDDSGTADRNDGKADSPDPLPPTNMASPADVQWNALLFYAAGDAEAEADILHTYAHEARSTADALRDAASRHDTRELSRISHKALPVNRQLGMTEITSLFEIWERQRDGFGWTDDIPEKVEKIANEMHKLADEAEKKANFALHKTRSDEETTVG